MSKTVIHSSYKLKVMICQHFQEWEMTDGSAYLDSEKDLEYVKHVHFLCTISTSCEVHPTIQRIRTVFSDKWAKVRAKPSRRSPRKKSKRKRTRTRPGIKLQRCKGRSTLREIITQCECLFMCHVPCTSLCYIFMIVYCVQVSYKLTANLFGAM